MREGGIHSPVVACESFKMFKGIYRLGGQGSRLCVAEGKVRQQLQWRQREGGLL